MSASLQPKPIAVASDENLPIPVNDVQSTTSFHEGGRMAYFTVFGGFLNTFCTFGLVQAFGVYEDYYTRFSLSEHTASQISWIGSLQLFFLFGLSLLAGKLFNDGYFHHMLILGSLLYVFSYFMLSLTKPHHYYQVILSQGVGAGLGMGFLFLPSISVVAQYFQRKRSTMLGVVVAGSSLGGVVHPIMLNHLFYNKKTDFAWAVRASAFLILGLLVISNLVMRTPLPAKGYRTKKAPKPDMRAIITDVPFLFGVLGTVIVYWGLFFPFFYLQLFAVLHGIDATIAFYSVTMLNGASFLGRIIPNILGDRYGSLNILILVELITGGLVFAMNRAVTQRGLIVFALLYGFFSGAVVSLGSPASAVFANSPEEVGLRIGFILSLQSIALLTGNPIAGALVQEPNYYWSRAITFSGVLILSGACFVIIARVKLGAKKNTWRL